ncbi:hypothetical protein [Janibacter terrae]|uniref:hypothetical protein n=1 Tax=Janibacter terrae TaxID=103817 RepID=UPI0038156B57
MADPGALVTPRLLGLVTMASASLARVALGALLAVVAARSLPPFEAQVLFQSLFLQSGAIAFLSASAFARGAALAHRQVAVSASWRSFLRFCSVWSVASTLIIGIALCIIVGTNNRDATLLGLLMGSGAAASALNAFIQGIATVSEGRIRAFAPGLGITSLTLLALGVALQGSSLMALVGIWCLSQIVMPVALLTAAPATRALLGGPGNEGHRGGDYFAATGVVNAGSVAAVFGYREQWARAHDARSAADGFYVSRLSELVLQVIYMAAASTPRILEGANRLARNRPGRTTLLVVGLLAGAFSLGANLVEPSTTKFRLGVAEITAMPIRVLASICLLMLLSRFTARAYLQAVVLSTLALAFTWFTPLGSGPLALSSVQALMCVTIVSWTAVASSGESK